eukprot:TRINITY_DN14818_c0_g2_i1.p1 TRINITY_DN14818_c0_g2~~TRINITY_DN14818_c0_g2_i1.p1  ORF type:complete len:538 (+),score=88.14 TRINITY_DN14818_c0_g2_i1:108-1721(+)
MRRFCGRLTSLLALFVAALLVPPARGAAVAAGKSLFQLREFGFGSRIASPRGGFPQHGDHRAEGGSGGHADPDGEEDSITLSVSATMLGAIACQMGLFYVVHFPDEDVRYYAYRTIGFGISLFSSLLIFSAINRCLAQFFSGSDHLPFLLAAGQALIWFITMQFIGGLLSGAIIVEELPRPGELSETHTSRELRKAWTFRRLNMKCWVTMLAEMTGLASMYALSTLQESSWFRQTPLHAFLVVPLGFVSILALFRASDHMRWWISMSDDGAISYAEEMWDEKLEDDENDVIALALSFVTVKAVLFWLIGVLPDEYGKYSDVVLREITANDCLMGFGFAALMGLCTLVLARSYHSLCVDMGHSVRNDLFARHVLIAVNYAMMCFAWSLLLATRLAATLMFPYLAPDGILLKLGVAFALTVTSFVSMILLDMSADRHEAGGEVERMLVRIIMANGLLVGFSWEVCFSKALHTVAVSFGHAGTLFNLMLSLGVAAVVVPAYRLYVLPRIHDHGVNLAQLGKGISFICDEDKVTPRSSGSA